MMRLSFIAAVVVQLAALAAAMSVRVDSNCPVSCGTSADCCIGNRCAKVFEGESKDGHGVSMSAFCPGFNPMTHRHGRMYTGLSVCPSELQ
ncbi:hypothetical protein EDB19DRAFT_943586 [Suillus lakei]|nr:hypothetical protein EDB19DRAFT_943586 [Suillus lakei]